MTHLREILATILAMVVIVLSGGNLPLGIVVWFAVWLCFMPHDRATPSAHRRYRMRETDRRRNRGQ